MSDQITVDVSNVHILDFKNKPSERPPMEKKRTRGPGSCSHLYVGAIVDSDAREIECGRCRAKLDPFKVIDAMIHHWESIAHWVKAHGEERARLEAEVRQLRIERSRLKSAIKKATPA